MSTAPHLDRIVAAFGGQNALARAIGASQGAVWKWLQVGHVPSRRIPAIIRAAADLPNPVKLTHAEFFAEEASQPAKVA